VYGRGGWRLGTITKVGRTTIYVAVTTPTSPDLVTTARIGGRWRERGYIKPRRKPLRSPTREERQSMDDAHAQGWHDEFPREFCPTCEETR
jgi:hypothetical protein